MSARDSANSLKAQIAEALLSDLSEEQIDQFNAYLELLFKWNARTNLTALDSRDEIISRHFVECIACAQMLSVDVRSLLDLGSGAGFPGVPISICRPELDVTLAESQNKKAAFLNEVVRQLELKVRVFSGRAETITASFDCVCLRAVDRMEQAIKTGVGLLNHQGLLLVMTTLQSEDAIRFIPGVAWNRAVQLPGSTQRIALLGNRL